MVKNILAQNDLNVGLHGPNFVLALSKYVVQTELGDEKSPSSQNFLEILANQMSNTLPIT